MTNTEFLQYLESWKALAVNNGVTLSSGKPLPDKFWHVFLGYSESAYKKFKGYHVDSRGIKPYTAKHIKLLSSLPEKAFIKELRCTLPEFYEVYPQFK